MKCQIWPLFQTIFVLLNPGITTSIKSAAWNALYLWLVARAVSILADPFQNIAYVLLRAIGPLFIQNQGKISYLRWPSPDQPFRHLSIYSFLANERASNMTPFTQVTTIAYHR